jgi:acyl-coenzyme A thioesterase PaaI-like protein
MTETDGGLTTMARASMPFTELLGVDLLAASPDEVRARISWEERLCTAGGMLHGGALMASPTPPARTAPSSTSR